MTNGNGINMLENFSIVASGLVGIFPGGSTECCCLVRERKKWRRLAEAMYEIHIFLKSQKKRNPKECDVKLCELWWAWKYAFEGVKFNKFHGLFCTTRNFIHKYGMAGRVSEESNAYFNRVLADIKRTLKSVSRTTGQVAMINARESSIKIKKQID